MTQITLTLPVNDEIARRFAHATPQEKAKLELLVSLCLWETIGAKPKQTLEQLMDEISAEAARRGLTPEILESILNED